MQKRVKIPPSPDTWLSTGSSMLNIASTDNPRYCLMPGAYYFLVGDSTSGKTWLTMTCFAESRKHPRFRDYEIHFDDVEGGAQMDLAHYFGAAVARDIQRHSSETIEDFYRRLYDLLVVKKKRIIYALDSQDALYSAAALKTFKKQKVAAEEGEKAKGSYGDGKALYHSQNIRWLLSALKKTGSILWIIGQTRDNPAGWGFDKKTRSGGKSLRFYAQVEIWTSLGKAIQKEVRGKVRNIGTRVIAEVRKNRITGKIGKGRAVEICIYNDYGIDDTGDMVNFLIEENEIKKIKRKDGSIAFKVPELELTGSRRQIVQFFEENDAVNVLQDMTERVWLDIEKECTLQGRRKRYE